MLHERVDSIHRVRYSVLTGFFRTSRRRTQTPRFQEIKSTTLWLHCDYTWLHWQASWQESFQKRAYRVAVRRYTLESWLTFCRIKNLEVTSYSAWCAFPLLQGLFIFLIHVLRNSDVQAAYLRKKQKWKELRSISTSRVSSKGVDVSSNTLANEDIQELTSRRMDRPRSSGAGYTNTSFLEQDRNLTPVQM